MSATAIIVDIVKAVIGKLSDKPAEWSVDKIAQAVADKATEALITVIAAELAKFQAALGVVLATHEVAEATQRVLEAMRAAERGGGLVARVLDGAQIEYVHVPIVDGGACRNCGATDLALPCPGPRT